MGSNLYRGLYMFFGMGAIISFLPTILLAWDMESILWQVSIASLLTNAGLVVLLAFLMVYTRQVKTMLRQQC